MSVATSTAILIGTGITAGGAVYGAHKAAGAQKDAAKTQAEGADKALQVQKEMYQQDRSDLGQSREDLAPYRGLGAGASNLLAQGLGFQLPAYTPPASPVPASSPGLATAAAKGATGAAALMPASLSTNRPQTTAPESAPMASLLGPSVQQQAAQAQTQSSYAVRAPNGQTYQIPRDQLQQALANGGQQVG